MQFEWDPGKAQENLEKHGLSFDEASTAFGDPLASTIYDPDHSHSERRFLLFGLTARGSYVVVSFTDRNGTIRVVTARYMTRSEIRGYEQ